MAFTASVQPESCRNVYASSDFPHLIRFRFSKEGLGHIVQNRTGSDLDVLVRFWPNASCPEASRCARIIGAWFLAERNQPVTNFPLSDSVAFFHRRPGGYCAKPARIRLVLADCVRFWPKGSGQCARITRPVSGQSYRADLDRMQIG